MRPGLGDGGGWQRVGERVTTKMLQVVQESNPSWPSATLVFVVTSRLDGRTQVAISFATGKARWTGGGELSNE